MLKNISPAHNIVETAPAGTIVGSFSVQEPDVGQSHIYSLTDDNGGIFQINDGNVLVKASEGRLSMTEIHAVSVTATDDGSPPKLV